MSYNKSIINYLIDLKEEYPLLFSKNKSNLNNNYNSPLQFSYDSKENIFINRESNKLNESNTIKSLVGRYYNKMELFVQTKGILKSIDILKVGANQIHLIDLKENKIAHLLIPKSDTEWFLNDIDIQLKIQKEKFRINTPLIQYIEKTVPYFVADFIKGDSYSELTITNQDEIVLELFKFYSDQKELLKKNCKDEFDKIVRVINESLKSIHSINTVLFEKKLKELIERIDISKIGARNEDLFYLRMVHGDLNYKENVIKTPDGRIYFFDWEMSRPANILYDYFYMLLYELNQIGTIENTLLFNFFNSAQLKSLSQKVNEYFDIKIQPNQILDYFFLSVLDMILYKILIVKKKRIPSLYKPELKKRFYSLEKYIDKIILVVDKTLNNNVSIN